MNANKLLRTTIINLLNDDDGINSTAHDGIVELCVINGWQDINDATECQDNRFFIHEDDVPALLGE